jgi:hypothetical protein
MGTTYFFALLSADVIPSRYERGRRLVRKAHLDTFEDQRAAKA